jgi:hypothetical protein
MWAVACSSAGIRVITAGAARYEPGDTKNVTKRGRTGVGCCRSRDAKSEMSAKGHLGTFRSRRREIHPITKMEVSKRGQWTVW